jgi:ribonuclease-3
MRAAAETAERLLGFSFRRPDLLAEALTHRSAVGQGGMGSNERLEFVGDRVLALLVAEWLIERFPGEREGALGPRLAHLVSRESLAGVAESMDLAAIITVSPGESRRGVRNRATVMADALEALIGAIYIDSGLDAARGFIRGHFAEALGAQTATPPKDAKTRLQEVALARGPDLPQYDLVERTGPAHAPRFLVRVSLAGDAAEGEAGTKRAAEQEAAGRLLARLA